jgi:hypothetical protein
VTIVTTRIVTGAIEIAGVTVGLTTAAVVARMLSVLQHACDGATDTQHAPMGSAAANTAITSTPIRHLTEPSSSHPRTIAMRAIKPPCDGNHLPK